MMYWQVTDTNCMKSLKALPLRAGMWGRANVKGPRTIPPPLNDFLVHTNQKIKKRGEVIVSCDFRKSGGSHPT